MTIVVPGFELRHMHKVDDLVSLGKWVHPGTRQKQYGLVAGGRLLGNKLVGSQTAARQLMDTDDFVALRSAALEAAAQAKLAAADQAAQAASGA
jgi:hypothetical protein